MMRRAVGAVLLALLLGALPAAASQWVIMAGYANSGTPKHGVMANGYFAPGGGYAFETRVDLARKAIWWGPEFTFWNNLTGDPLIDYNSSYFQAEFGARASVRTRTTPAFYGGLGAGYSFAHGSFVNRFDNTNKQSFDGDFPVGSIHAGTKTVVGTSGIGLAAEASYHMGFGKAAGRNGIGPAQAFLIQIGFVFDVQPQSKP